MNAPVDDLTAWVPYLRAFDAHLAARAAGHPFTAGLARREMLRYLDASPDYWRARRKRRERLAVSTSHRRAA